MGAATIQNVHLAGLATAVPPLRVRTWEEAGVPADRFVKARTQGRQPAVRAAAWEQCQSDFCVRAAEALMEKLGWTPEQIDVVILVTLTPDYPIPATAIILQDRLRIPKTAVAFDLPGSEATFLHGLQLMASMLSGGHLRRGLLLCGEVSKVVIGSEGIESPDQICGHNGSVCALEHTPGAAPMYFQSGGDGQAHLACHMPIGGTRRPPRAEMFQGGTVAPMDFILDLPAVEAMALRALPACVREVLTLAVRHIGEVDHFFLQPITLATEDRIRRELGISRDRFHTLTPEFGRGGSGGIVLSMLTRATTELAAGRVTSLLAGLGAGLTWSSALLQTEGVLCLDPIEME